MPRCAGWTGKGSQWVQCGHGSGLVMEVVVWSINPASLTDHNCGAKRATLTCYTWVAEPATAFPGSTNNCRDVAREALVQACQH